MNIPTEDLASDDAKLIQANIALYTKEVTKYSEDLPGLYLKIDTNRDLIA